MNKMLGTLNVTDSAEMLALNIYQDVTDLELESKLSDLIEEKHKLILATSQEIVDNIPKHKLAALLSYLSTTTDVGAGRKLINQFLLKGKYDEVMGLLKITSAKCNALAKQRAAELNLWEKAEVNTPKSKSKSKIKHLVSKLPIKPNTVRTISVTALLTVVGGLIEKIKDDTYLTTIIGIPTSIFLCTIFYRMYKSFKLKGDNNAE